MSPTDAHLRYLIDAVIDGRASEEDLHELEAAALTDVVVLREYVDAVNLHTSLQWDFGNVKEAAPRQTSLDPMIRPRRQVRQLARRSISLLGSVALLLLIGVVVATRSGSGPPALVDNGSGSTISTEAGTRESTGPLLADVDLPQDDHRTTDDGTKLIPLGPFIVDSSPETPAASETESTNPVPTASPRPATEMTLADFIDDRLQVRWNEEGITPSPLAEPTVWLRRASLDLKGRIPTLDEIEEFLVADEATRRAAFVADALASGEYADHFATIWSNLLVGRSRQNSQYRDRLHGYLVDAFATNQSWGDVVGQLVSAEGTEEHAPTNFLLAHLNNEAVPATAITSRVLLGRQLQCTQCHAHPFNDWKQDEFWELNAFFQQCDVERRRGEDGRSVRVLVDSAEGGPTFFEDRRGLMKVAYPIYGGERVDEAPEVRRREELAKLLVDGETNDLARAMVNRVWAHFLGVGFTVEVDDLGPHAAVSHPELLDRLARDFVASGYDVRQLVTWVTGSAAYQLSSEWSDKNAYDRPEIGEPPLFSRAYEKRLTPEQLYESLVTAAVGPRRAVAGLPSRDEWVAAFYAAQDNEENSEMSTFDESPSVALELMNGSLTSHLVSSSDAAALSKVLSMKAPEDERLDTLSRLVLGRDTTADERKVLRRVLRPTIKAYSASLPTAVATQEGYRDLFWAYVNSSEFVVVR